jgi:hypothetical protein
LTTGGIKLEVKPPVGENGSVKVEVGDDDSKSFHSNIFDEEIVKTEELAEILNDSNKSQSYKSLLLVTYNSPK